MFQDYAENLGFFFLMYEIASGVHNILFPLISILCKSLQGLQGFSKGTSV